MTPIGHSGIFGLEYGQRKFIFDFMFKNYILMFLVEKKLNVPHTIIYLSNH